MKTLEEEWIEICARNFPATLPDAEEEVMRWAFFRGAAVLLTKINRLQDSGSLAEAAEEIATIKKELMTYFASLAMEIDDMEKH